MFFNGGDGQLGLFLRWTIPVILFTTHGYCARWTILPWYYSCEHCSFYRSNSGSH